MISNDTEQKRQALLAAYAAAVRAVDGERVTANWLREHPAEGPVALIALGKAAGAMALGAQRALGQQLFRGLLVTKPGHADSQALDLERIRVCEGAHPLPDETSLAAGQALLDFIEDLPAGLPVLVLISGGASALVEVLRPGVTLEGLARANDWLLANGLPIAEINAVRRRLSRLKGGGLATMLGGRTVTGLLISDVEGDDPAVIGSGPLNSPGSRRLPDGLPGWLQEMLPAGQAETAPAASEVRVVLVATLDDALVAAEAELVSRGLQVRLHTPHLDGDILDVVERVAAAVRAEPGLVHLWGGEATVILPPAPGRGGRNQQLALHLAGVLAGDAAAVALSAGTDGTDGPTADAGGLVDNLTIDRGRTEGLVLEDYLRRADAGSFLEQTGDLISTGPTGTNVTDLVIAWRT